MSDTRRGHGQLKSATAGGSYLFKTPSFNGSPVGIGGNQAVDSGEEESNKGDRETHLDEEGFFGAGVMIADSSG